MPISVKISPPPSEVKLPANLIDELSVTPALPAKRSFTVLPAQSPYIVPIVTSPVILKISPSGGSVMVEAEAILLTPDPVSLLP